MMRLVMEAVMIITIVSCLVFMMKVSANENKIDNAAVDKENDVEPDKD